MTSWYNLAEQDLRMMKVKMKFRARCEPSKAPKSSNRQIHRFNCKKARLQYLRTLAAHPDQIMLVCAP